MKKHYIIIGSLAGVAAVLCVLIIFKGISQIITDNADVSSIENTNVKNNKIVEVSKTVENNTNSENTESAGKSNNIKPSRNYENNKSFENTESDGKSNNIEPSKNVENNNKLNGKGTNKGLTNFFIIRSFK